MGKRDQDFLNFFSEEPILRGSSRKPKASVKPKAPPKPTPAPKPRSSRRKSKRAKRIADRRTAKPITLSKPDRRCPFKVMQMFASEIEPGTEPIYIGIDPGVTGAFGLIHPDDPRQTTVLDIPCLLIPMGKRKNKKGNIPNRSFYNVDAIWEMFQHLLPHKERLLVCLEQGMPYKMDTPVTAWSVGMSYGLWPLFLRSQDIKLVEVLPVTWKAKLGLRNADKELSRYTAQKLFPHAPLFNVGDHNRAEALLIAEYFRRERNS